MCLFLVNDGSKIDPIKIFESIHSFDSNICGLLASFTQLTVKFVTLRNL